MDEFKKTEILNTLDEMKSLYDPKMDSKKMAVVAKYFLLDLDKFKIDVIHRAFEHYRRHEEYFPKPADIYKLCENLNENEYENRTEIRLANIAPSSPPEWFPMTDEKNYARVWAIFFGIKEQNGMDDAKEFGRYWNKKHIIPEGFDRQYAGKDMGVISVTELQARGVI